MVAIEKDRGQTKVSDYRWVNILVDDTMVGKARLYYWVTRAVVYSINIFPEFQGRGYGRSAIDSLQRDFDTVIADRVRGTARGFWARMGFSPDGKGNYVWRRFALRRAPELAA